MNARRDTPTTAWNRRQFLRAGGLTVSAGALLAACGGSGSENGIPRVGTVPTATDLPTVGITDLALLRTATSLEYSALYTYNALASHISGDEATLAARFMADHTGHAEAAAALTEQLGGEVYACANPRLQAVYVEPALRLILGSKAAADELGIEEPAVEIAPSLTMVDDILVLANALESLAAATYQSMTVMLNDKSLRSQIMVIGAQEAQHAAVLGLRLNPSQPVAIDGVAAAPATTEAPTDSAAPSGTEAPVAVAPTPVYAIPSTFGQLSPIQFQLGAPNESGIRTTLNLETPSLNSLVYEYLGACSA